ncbi:MAG: HAMP domain-containing histidine kinase [Ezakiella sp.]|nr:HAMP domain-containing histidine kinase [Ezakiella sp.]
MKRNSISFKLTLAIIVIFIIMIITTNFAMNKAYQYSAKTLSKQFEVYFNEGDDIDEVLIIFDDAINSSTFYFKILSAIIIGAISLIGAGIFYFLIRNMLKPLNELTNKIKDIDIDNIDEDVNAIEEIEGSSEIKELTLAFNQALNKISEDYKDKKEFSQNVAHELKTPVAIIRAKIELEKKTNNSEFILSIDNSIDRLQKLIDGILIMSDHNKLNLEYADIKPIVEELALDLEKNYKDEVQFAISGSLNINTDIVLIQRVIYNLMDNACKYGIKNELIHIYMDDVDKTIEVVNKGSHIDEEELNKIFDLFYRSDKSRSRKTGGYGIGLAIVKNILNKLNASIVAKNTEEGMSFKIYF